MSRYIDADAMLEYLDLMYEHQDDKDEPYNIGILGAINYIKHKAPSIDIVRCKECKHWHKTDRGITYCDCITYGFNHTEDDFCSHGERKESE